MTKDGQWADKDMTIGFALILLALNLSWKKKKSDKHRFIIHTIFIQSLFNLVFLIKFSSLFFKALKQIEKQSLLVESTVTLNSVCDTNQQL